MRHAMLLSLVLSAASACRRTKDASPQSVAAHGPRGVNLDKLNHPRIEPPVAVAHDEGVAK